MLNEIRKKLTDRWKADFMWIPLNGFPYPDDTNYFNRDEFEANFGFKKLISAVKKVNGEENIFLISEIKEDKEISPNQISSFNSIEKFYVDKNADWIIYLSHENTIAFGGKKLIDQIKKNWPECEKFEFPWEKIK